MKAKISLGIILSFFCSIIHAQQIKQYDSTMKIGKAGYKVRCNNKKADKNNLNINPVGFESGARDADIEIKGRITKAEVDDLNNDGFPDMVMYVFNEKNKGTVIGVSSSKNEGMLPMLFPDITDDAKLRVGYNGYDEFELLQGTLLRRFPVFDLTDPNNPKPTAITRQIQYRVVTGDRGVLKFTVLRSFDVDKSKK